MASRVLAAVESGKVSAGDCETLKSAWAPLLDPKATKSQLK